MTASCAWTEDGDGAWHTACGEAHVFLTEGPEKNRCRFCPYCGKALAVTYSRCRCPRCDALPWRFEEVCPACVEELEAG